jgi:hypothetical protein
MFEIYISKYNTSLDDPAGLFNRLFTDHYCRLDEIVSWLEETFGKNYTELFGMKISKLNKRWYMTQHSGIHYYFRNNEDAILFKLTWC